MTPSLPTTGNPVSSTFAWTPTAAQLGAQLVTFTAIDNTGLQAQCPVTLTVTKPGILTGDIDGDHQITATDARLILEVLVRLTTADVPPAMNFSASGDVNADDVINNLDAVLLLGVLGGKIPPLPDNTRISATDNGNGNATVAGTAGAVPPGSRVRLTNATSGATVLSAPAGTGGRFSATIAAALGDRITVAVVDAAGNPGPARLAITVQKMFQTARPFAAGNAPSSVTVARVNSDSHGDIVTANQNANNITILLGNGDGTFRAAQPFAAGTTPLSVAVADVNGDTRLDVITANADSDAIAVLLGNGDGTFQTAQPFAAGDSPQSVAVADVNGDSRLDVITANGNSNDIAVLLGNGNGTFQAAQFFNVGTGPFAVVVADVNGDDRPDVITANQNADNITILLGNGDGTFQAAQFFAAGLAPSSVAVADVNGDGRPDVITANFGSDDVSVLLHR